MTGGLFATAAQTVAPEGDFCNTQVLLVVFIGGTISLEGTTTFGSMRPIKPHYLKI